MYLKKIKIGNVELNNNIVLAPMAGITDKPFRLICEKFSPGLVCTEMISAKGLFYDDSKTKMLLDIENEKRPIAVQIFGSDVESMGYAAKYVSKYADIIDINMGCPAPKVVKNGDGSKLLLDLDLAESIVKEVVKNAIVPVTVKFRKGWNADNIVAVEAAKRFEKVGASAITIHGRTREEFYSGTCDLEIIKQVKEAVKIPVIGSGDVRTPKEAINMFEKTNVDGVMIGRATLGKPWIFREILSYLSGEEVIPIQNQERFDIIIEHIDFAIEQKGEFVAIKEMRKHIGGYIKNLPEASSFRDEVNKINTKEQLIEELKEYFNYIKNIL